MMAKTRKFGFPLIILNLKTYNESSGEGAVQLARVAEEVSLKTGVSLAVAPQLLDLLRVASSVKIPILAQHVDPYEPGPYTGYSSVEAVKQAGAAGSIVNHSEHTLKLSEIDQVVQKMRRLGLASIACTNTVQASAAVAALEPDVIAIEPPELIGTGIPVSKAKPEIVSDSVDVIKRINSNVTVLCGAGITKGEDAAAAIKLGTRGILVASGVVKAQNPSDALMDLANALKS